MDLNRLRCIILVFFILFGLYIGVNSVTFWLMGPTWEVLRPDDGSVHSRLMEKSYLDYQGRQVAGALAWKEQNLQQDLGLVFGASSVRNDIDPSLLYDITGQRWLVTGSVGGSMERTYAFAQLLDLHDVKPNRIVIGLNPLMLYGLYWEEDWQPERGPWHWAYNNRLFVSNYVQDTLLHWRLEVFRYFNLGARTLFPAAADPWTPMLDEALKETTHKAKLRRLQTMGHFTAQAYIDQINGPQGRGLLKLIQQLQQYRVPTVLVLMPQAPYMQAMMPEEALTSFKKILADGLEQPIPIVDMRYGLPKSSFIDAYHLNAAGRQQFTRMFAEILNKQWHELSNSSSRQRKESVLDSSPRVDRGR